MNENEQLAGSSNINDEPGEPSKSHLLTDNNLQYSENLNFGHSLFEHNDSIQGPSDPVKFLDLQRMHIEQKNAMMDLKMSAYEKAIVERDNTIQSLHTQMINSQNDSFVLSHQYQNIMEKTKSVSDACICLNTNFTKVCERLNRLGDTVDNVKIRQKDVKILVDLTTTTFQEKILNISNGIEDSLKQVNLEKIRVNQELEVLKINYSRDLSTYKTNLEECSTEIENLKSKNNALVDTCNESIIKLNEEKESTFRLNQHFEKELKDMEYQNKLLVYDNSSINKKLEEILNENQTLKDEIVVMRTSLDTSEKQLNAQLQLVKEQTELLENQKISVELNDKLKKDNLILKQRNEDLEKTNRDIMEGLNKNKLSQNEIQVEKEIQFQEMCNNYDKLLKMQEEKVIELTETLVFQKEKEKEIENDMIELKQEILEYTTTIVDLQENVKAKDILIPDLQSEIQDLKHKLENTNKNLCDSATKFLSEKNELEITKNELENQNKDNFKQIEKLTVNYMKYKSKSKQLYAEVMRLRFQCSRSDHKKTFQLTTPQETIDIMSDDEENIEDDDVSIIEFNDKDISNLNASMQSTTNKISHYSNSKRNCSPLKYVNNSKVKKQKTRIDIVAQQENIKYNQHLKENHALKSFDLNSSNQKLNENKNFIKSISNASPNQNSITKFKKPSVKHQRKSKPSNVQNTENLRTNSPVILTPASSNTNIVYLEKVFGSNC